MCVCPDTNPCCFATDHVNSLHNIFGLRYSLLSSTATPYSADDGPTERGLLSCVPSTSLVGGLAQMALLCSLKALFPSRLVSTGMSQHTCYLCPWASLPPGCPPSFTHHEHRPSPRTHGRAGSAPLGVLWVWGYVGGWWRTLSSPELERILWHLRRINLHEEALRCFGKGRAGC